MKLNLAEAKMNEKKKIEEKLQPLEITIQTLEKTITTLKCDLVDKEKKLLCKESELMLKNEQYQQLEDSFRLQLKDNEEAQYNAIEAGFKTQFEQWKTEESAKLMIVRKNNPPAPHVELKAHPSEINLRCRFVSTATHPVCLD